MAKRRKRESGRVLLGEAQKRPGIILREGLGRWQFPTLGKALRFSQGMGFKSPLFLDRITRRILNPGRRVL